MTFVSSTERKASLFRMYSPAAFQLDIRKARYHFSEKKNTFCFCINLDFSSRIYEMNWSYVIFLQTIWMPVFGTKHIFCATTKRKICEN